MRILLIHNYYQHRGGEDTVVQQETDLLSKKNEIKVVTTKNKRGLKGILQFLSYPINIVEALRILKTVQSFNPDIVHVHNLHYAIGPWVIKTLKKKNIPIIMTLHNFRLVCPSATLFFNNKLFTKSLNEDFPWTAVRQKVLDNSLLKTSITAFVYWLHKKLGTWRMVDQFIVLSDFSKNILLHSKLGLAAEKFTIKPNFSTVSTDKPKEFDDFFVYIGRLSSEKGILQLLKAFANTKYKLKIFGTGPLEKEVVQFSKDNVNIHFMGFQKEDTLRENLRHASALIVPSVCYEGMPMTILEAYAIGTPVLSSAIGILEEMVVPLYTGLHFDPYSSESIQNVLEQWQNISPHNKLAISNNCIKTFRANYTADRNIEQLMSIYNHAIEQNNISK